MVVFGADVSRHLVLIFIHCSYIFVSVSQEDWTWEGDQEVGARGVSFWPWSDFWRLRALGRAKQEVNGGSLFRGGERLWRMWTWRGLSRLGFEVSFGVCSVFHLLETLRGSVPW